MKNLKRRDFIKTTVAAGVGASIMVSGIVKGSDPETGQSIKPLLIPQKKKKVIVAGAGIAGLCCGYELMRLGYDVVVMEASPRHGGHVFTVHDGLSDGLYADFGAEHITRQGYERYWEYTKEFNLSVLSYPRRVNMLRRIKGKFYSEDMLADPSILKKFGFNDREVEYLSENRWSNLRLLFLKPYLGKFTNENQPFGIGYDHLDKVPVTDLYKKEGASAEALTLLGGKNTSSLFELWRCAIMDFRGIKFSSPDVFRLKGGNQELPNAFAKRLGERVKLNCPVTSIRHGDSGVTVTYKEFDEQKEMSADFLANCIPLPAFKSIPITPALPAAKQFVVDNVVYDSYSRFVFQARSKFWLDDNLSINMELDHPDISSIWQVADEIDTHRVALMATGPGGVSAQRALAAVRQVYPGKRDTIEQALVKDWTKEQFSYTCERLDFSIGNLDKFWPQVTMPHGRIHFAGAYADNLNRGMEAATRSANRVAKEIEQA